MYIAFEVLQKYANPTLGGSPVTGTVGSYDDVLHVPEGIAQWQRLITGWENVKASNPASEMILAPWNSSLSRLSN